ncbi:septum formation inhibitor MinC, partial [Mesorhizobium sp. M2D.F.Ca.ET.145.01.1.1]
VFSDRGKDAGKPDEGKAAEIKAEAGKGKAAKATDAGATDAVQAGTLMVKSPIRSGQSIFHPHGDVIVLGSVASGS